MSEVDLSAPATEVRPPDLAAVISEPPKVEMPEAAAPPGSPESNTKGMLRDAIQKVMEEIDYHEREAKRHMQLAEDLRKDLRESFTFMLEQKEGKLPGATSDEDRPAKAVEPSPPESAKGPAVEKRPRPGKKRAGKKTRGG